MEKPKHRWRTFMAMLPIKRFRNPPAVVAVIRLSGVIGQKGTLRNGLNLEGVQKSIDRAFALYNLKAVALAVNSPGGSPVQSSLIAGRIRDLAEEKDIPVFCFVEDVAASGGYWLACAGDEIYADENSIVGSIGVVYSGFGFEELLQRIGVERRLHTAGKSKAMLDPFSPEKKADVKHLKDVQKEIHDSFANYVKKRRGDRISAPEETVLSGAWWTGVRALEMGLVDGIGNMRAVLLARYGEDVQIVPVETPKPLWRRLTGKGASNAGVAWVESLVDVVEEKSMWSRFGL